MVKTPVKPRPTAVLLFAPEYPTDRQKVARIAGALGQSGSLNVVMAEPAFTQFSPGSFTVNFPPDPSGNGWWCVRPSFVGSFGISSKLPVRLGWFPTTGDFPSESGDEAPYDVWVNHALSRIGDQSIAVNYEDFICRLALKDVLEMRCREYEKRSGRRINRPLTWIVPPGDVSSLRGELAKNEIYPFIVKPANSSRARGISILRSPEQLESVEGRRVIQELVKNPFRVDGHKVDARVYVAVWNGPPLRGALCAHMMLRQAPDPYRVGDETSEICNISYAKRIGRGVKAASLETMMGKGAASRRVQAAVEATLREFFNMLAAWRTNTPFFGFWGIDMALSARGPQIEASLLEVNTAPEIYRDHKTLDGQTDTMLSSEMAPLLALYLTQGMRSFTGRTVTAGPLFIASEN